MKVSVSQPGHVLSAAVHMALLAATLVSFTETKPFQDAQESVPVEIVTDSQFNEITKGEKTAKEVTQTPVKADKVAEVEEKKPTPIREAKTEVTPPPPPLRRIPDPGESQQPEPPTPTPPQRVAALPPEPPKAEPEPVKPEPPRPPTRPPEPAKVEAPPPKPDAEPVEPPKPPQRPKEEPKKAEVAPTPPPPTPPKPPVRPKTEEKPLDPAAIAKLLKDTEPQKPVARSKSGDETAAKTKYDANAMSDLLSREAPSQKASTARTASQQASLGARLGKDDKISQTLMNKINEIMLREYKRCWTYIELDPPRWQPQIKVEFAMNGALIGEPVLVNQPADLRQGKLAESAMRAIRCANPLPITNEFAPIYNDWRSRTLRFDPLDMAE